MPHRDYVNRLETAGLIAPGSYGKGLPVWLGPGRSLIERMQQAYLDEVRSRYTVHELEYPMFVRYSDYMRLYQSVNPYVNFYRVAGQDVMVRADTLHLQIPLLLSLGSTNEACACTSGIWRYETGFTTPGFRDRYLHALQLNVAADPQDLEATLDFLGQTLERFFDELCLPGLTVDAGPWRDYLDCRLLTVHGLPDGRLTITSTLFVLGPLFQRYFSTTRYLFDVGITEKILAVLAMVQEGKGLSLPNRLAPVQVALMPRRGMTGPVPEFLRQDWWHRCAPSVRTAHVEAECGHLAHAAAKFIRRGVPLVATDARVPGNVNLYGTEMRMVRAEDAPRLVPELLAQNDSSLRSRAAALLREAAGSGAPGHGAFLGLCNECAIRRADVLGIILPRQEAACHECGRRGYVRLITGPRRLY